jgi:hypothetical protein
MSLVDAVGLWLLVGTVGLLGLSIVFKRPWWGQFWRGLSTLLDPPRSGQWLLKPVIVFVVLAAVGAVAKITQSVWLTAFWVVLVGLNVFWFLRARYQNNRYRNALSNGFAVDMNVWKTNGDYGRLDRWAGTVGLPKRSILVAGASGAGKTEAAKHLVQQMLFEEESLILVYDHKSDFQEFFDDRDIDYVKISMNDSSHVWNCFREFEDGHDIDEFARALFPELSGGENDFFDDTARQVFAACLKMMLIRNGSWEGLSNANVRHYFQTHGVEEVYEDLNEFDEFRAAASAIDVESSSKQAQGVYASVQRIVNKVFVGDFGAEPDEANSDFAIREYIQDPQGIPIVLDFPKATGQSTKPIFRFLIDHAAMFAMEDADTQSYFVLDEFAQIPHLRRLEELINVGRGEKVTTLVTLQSVSQLLRNYGRDAGESILSGLVSMILLRPNDEATVDFYRAAIGTDFKTYTQHVEDKDTRDEKRETKQVEEHPFSVGQLRRWDAGVGVVVTQAGWLHGYIPMLTQKTEDFVTNVLGTSDDEEDNDQDALPEQDTVDGRLEGEEVGGQLESGDAEQTCKQDQEHE